MKIKNKNILITGGAGFIGSHLAKALVQDNRITIVDNLERGSLQFIEELKNRVFLFIGDLKDPLFCDQVFNSSYDVVIHMASKVGGIGYYTSKPYEVINEMTLIDANVLRSTLKYNIPHYLYASSAHVYPIELQGEVDSIPIKECQAYPSNPELSYGWAKLIGEKQIEYASSENKNFTAAIARYIGIFGPNQDYNLDTGSVIPVFAHRALNYPDTPFSIWGTGKETRSYCYIDDAIECTKLMLDKLDEGKMVGPLNVGKQERTSITEIAEKMIHISEKNINIEYDSTKPTLIWGQWCDCSLAEKVLGWRAQTDFHDGLNKIYTDINRRMNG